MKKNPFKAALQANKQLIGCWVGTASPYLTEIYASIGFDWLALDGEHGPNDLRSILGQLQAMAGYDSAPVVRLPHGDATRIKQLLDAGAQNLLIPMVESAEQAAALAAAMRYPPQGVRGVGTALARASQWKQIPDYLQRANEEVCLLVQAETVTAMEHLEEIAAVDGVDGVFFGPADLAASMGLILEPGHPSVKAAVEEGMKLVLSKGKAAGILTADKAFAQRCLDLGAQFVAVGVDTLMIVNSARALLQQYR